MELALIRRWDFYRRGDTARRFHPLFSALVKGQCLRISRSFPGAQKDYVIVGSDSGRIVILEYNKEKNAFDKIHQETFGKSGCRRIVPGQVRRVVCRHFADSGDGPVHDRQVDSAPR